MCFCKVKNIEVGILEVQNDSGSEWNVHLVFMQLRKCDSRTLAVGNFVEDDTEWLQEAELQRTFSDIFQARLV